ncbi:TonB-dependent receptor [Dyadobacter fermentans]|uniref:TonB-dependent receptor n=1 Tax=Dyadobacter fermentans (strain ATCC 700827 / DSM 18053 / CIP 107007 / KCTC 52180 / NS114) TaxID=471854 RepID=C6W4U8_DYAFD|nr:TonB-dependent receptor [Dyadobacter fermentans]ACT95922.1 TonB-dependent receptor [Dyadobacter fermentans DSM 18053]
MIRTLLHILLLVSSTTMLQAGTLKGKLLEAATGEPALGVVISIEGTSLHDISGLDGSFSIPNLQKGSYRLTIRHISYAPVQREFAVNGNEVIQMDLSLEAADVKLAEVAVTGKRDGASDNTARLMERNASQVMNIVSGKTIQISPDLTVANVIQRISGISIERNSNGDGQHAILRGMDKRYNYTLVNGVKIPSPDNKYRYVPLDIFPSDLLDRLEVYKALTPAMEGDAIGGAVNMVMKDAPDKFTFSANVSTGYNELFVDRKFMGYDFKNIQSKSPYERNGNLYNATAADFSTATVDYKLKTPAPNLLGSIAVGNRFLNDKLGILLAGSYQNTHRGSNSLFFDSETVDTLRGEALTKMSERRYSEQQIRYGLHSKIDFRVNDKHKIQLYNAFMNLTNVQVRDVKSTQLTIGGYDPVAGNATLGFSTRSRLTRQQIFNSTLQGKHQLLNALALQWSAVYSKATNEVPDNVTVPLIGFRENFRERKTTVGDASRRWEHNSDRDLSAYLNLTYNTTIGSTQLEWTAGGLFRDKSRSNFYNNYQLRPADPFAEFGKDFTDYTQIRWTIQNPRGSVASALNYNATEQIKAGFIQFKAETKNLEILGGVRAEATHQGYSMLFPIGEDRPNGNQQYTDILPSLHFKYKPEGNVNLRASYFRSINRPGFFEIVPYRIVLEEYQERGNPDLKRAVADNIDLRYELFPRASEQFMVGVFYKMIKDPIEYTLRRDAVRGQDIYYSPGNFGNAKNYGLEIDYIKYVKQFGIKANYTYTHSRIATTKSRRIRNESGDLETINVEQTRPLYGQSAHVANLSVLYKNQQNGIDAQLAGGYTGDRINTVSQFIDNDLCQKRFIQMDASLEKTFRNGLGVFVKANNLLNTPMEVYINNVNASNARIPNQDLPGKTLIRRDRYQRSYLLGVRYKF